MQNTSPGTIRKRSKTPQTKEKNFKALARRIFKRFNDSPYRIPIALAMILYGAVAFLTPFTPGSWLFLVGLALLGVGPLKKYLSNS